MKNIVFGIVLSFALATLSACITSGSPGDTRQLLVGQIYEHGFQYGTSSYVPLPPGPWKVGAIEVNRVGNGSSLLGAILYQGEESRMSKLVEVWSNADTARTSSGVHHYCERDDMHFRETLANGSKKFDCFWVNHFRMSVNPTNRWWRFFSDAYDHAEQQGYKRPLVGIGPGFTMYEGGKEVFVQYFVDPESLGFGEPKRVDWSTSDWHPQYIANHADKSHYVSRLIEWAKATHPLITQGFYGNEGALPPLPAKSD